jgi:phage gp46-like protein
LYAPDNKYGSDFYAQVKRRSTDDASYFENLAANALEELINDGRAQTVEATVTEASRAGVALTIQITDAQGTEERVVFKGLGV